MKVRARGREWCQSTQLVELRRLAPLSASGSIFKKTIFSFCFLAASGSSISAAGPPEGPPEVPFLELHICKYVIYIYVITYRAENI